MKFTFYFLLCAAPWDYHLYIGLKKVADIKADGTVEYYLTDHLGTVNATLDDQGAVTQRYTFGPYGNLEYAEGNSDNRYLFQGKELDLESGDYYFGARYYDAEAGRWTARDPKEEFFSSYVYCANNPLAFVDPDGEGLKSVLLLMVAISTINLGSSGVSSYLSSPDNNKNGAFFNGVAAGVDMLPYSMAVGLVNPYAGMFVAGYGGDYIGQYKAGKLSNPEFKYSDVDEDRSLIIGLSSGLGGLLMASKLGISTRLMGTPLLGETTITLTDAVVLSTGELIGNSLGTSIANLGNANESVKQKSSFPLLGPALDYHEEKGSWKGFSLKIYKDQFYEKFGLNMDVSNEKK